MEQDLEDTDVELDSTGGRTRQDGGDMSTHRKRSATPIQMKLKKTICDSVTNETEQQATRKRIGDSDHEDNTNNETKNEKILDIDNGMITKNEYFGTEAHGTRGSSSTLLGKS